MRKCCYIINNEDQVINTTDPPDYGNKIDISYMSDDDFYNNVFVFVNGLLYGNRLDFWRVDNNRSELVFYRELRKRDIVYIVIFE